MKENIVKTLFKCVVNGALPATVITSVQTVMENMFTVVKVVGDTVTLKLADSLGGATFDLKWHLEMLTTENGVTYIKVWDALPADVQEKIMGFVSDNIPDGTFAHFIPDPDTLNYIIEGLKNGGSILVDHGGKTLSFAGKVFQVSGFVPAVAIGIIIKILFRFAFDKVKPTLKKVGQDVATTVASASAVWVTKCVMVATILHPPALPVYLISAGVGIVVAAGVKKLIKGK